ncbi:hypothetical protein Q7C36_004296 [Tachysurus vachellii]|uniref:Uncharacterized protein n=1 Tax=Tachysurus vachellii TaxID=175792 RepID=A0AA88T1K3_TACVA|nr:hypothetical protein Q7C36_004296 [Tachysurus vachellii]
MEVTASGGCDLAPKMTSALDLAKEKQESQKPEVSHGKCLMENMDVSGQRGEPGLHITWTPAGTPCQETKHCLP